MTNRKLILGVLLIALLLITTASATDLFNATPFKGGVANGIMNGTGSTSTTGWVGDEKYSWYATRVATTGSVNFNTTSAANGTQSLDITITDATGHFVVNNTPDVTLPSLSKYAIPVSPSTTYNVYAWVKTSNAQGTGAYISTTQFSSTGVAGTVSTSSKLTGTNGYTKIGYTVTTDSNAAYMVVMLDHAAGAAQIINFDSVTVETAISDNYTGAGGRVYPIVNDSTSIDNIDQSADTGGAYANTYTCPSGVVESAANEIAITTTKSQITQIGVWVVNKGTGDMGVEFHDASNKNIVSYNLTTAQLSNGAFNFFPSPAVVSPGTYHVHVLSATHDATVKTNTASDLSTASFEEEYAKNTEEINTCVNNVCMNLTSNGSVVGDPFGIPPNTTVDTYRGYYNSSSNLTFANRQISSSDILALSSVYDIQPQLGNTEPSALKGWSVGAPLLGRGYLASGTTSDPVNVTWKYNTMLPVHTVDVSFIYYGFAGLSAELSGDGNTWSDTTTLSSTAGWQTTTIHSSQYDKNTTVYVRIKKDTTTSSLAWTAIYFNATLNTTTTNLTTLTYVTGNNYVNVSSNGRAASSSLDPSLQADVWFYKVAGTIANLIPNFAANTTTGYPGDYFQFTDTSSGSPITWDYGFGDGSNSTLQNPLHQYLTTGSFNVFLNISNSTSSNWTQKNNYITILTLPVPSAPTFTVNKSYSTILPFNVLFTITSAAPPHMTNYNMSFGDGTWSNFTGSSFGTITHTYSTIGIFSPTLYVSNTAGTANTTNTNMVDVTDPVAYLLNNPTNINYGVPQNITLVVDNLSHADAVLVNITYNKTGLEIKNVYSGSETSWLQISAIGSGFIIINMSNIDKSYSTNTSMALIQFNVTTPSVNSSAEPLTFVANTGVIPNTSYTAGLYPFNKTFNGAINPLNNVLTQTFTFYRYDSKTLMNNIQITNSYTGVINGTQYTTNGVLTLSSTWGFINLTSTASAFYTSDLYNLEIKGSNTDVYMTSFQGQQYNTVFYPQLYRIIVTNLNLVPLSNLSISATPQNWTNPAGWQTTLLGINPGVTLVGTSMIGTTGTDGTFGMPMVAAINYIYVINGTADSGDTVLNYRTNVFPPVAQADVIIKVPTDKTPPWTTPTPSTVSYSISNTTISNNSEQISMSYTDATSNSTVLNFFVYNQSGHLIASQNYTGAAANSETYTVTVTHALGQSVQYGFNAHQGLSGWINSSKSLSWYNTPTLFGSGSPGVYDQWVAIILLVLVAGGFSVAAVKMGGIIIPILGMFLSGIIFWLQPAIGVDKMAVVLMWWAVLGVINYIRKSEIKII